MSDSRPRIDGLAGDRARSDRGDSGGLSAGQGGGAGSGGDGKGVRILRSVGEGEGDVGRGT